MDYSKYRMSYKEYIFCYLKGILVVIFLSYLFYKNAMISFVLLPLSYIYVRQEKKRLAKERKRQLTQEFKECIACVASALNAGYSLENSFYEAYMELQKVLEEDSCMLQELEMMLYGLQNNMTTEEYLQDFAMRSDIEDIRDFVQVLVTAKRRGGNLIRIIKNTSRNIGDRIELENEIRTMIAAKNLEANIMNVVPLGIILYMWLGSPGFLDVLYHNAMGMCIMTVVLLVYLGCFYMTKKIMDIRI